MARLSSAQWLGRLRAKGWTRDQIQQATGASPRTQLRIAKGEQRTSKYDSAIREAGQKYSRRKEPPPEYPHRPRPKLSRILTGLRRVELEPNDSELEDLKERFGSRGRLAILQGQLDANARYQRVGKLGRNDPESWFFHKGPDMMRKFNDHELYDPYFYIKQLWYAGVQP